MPASNSPRHLLGRLRDVNIKMSKSWLIQSDLWILNPCNTFRQPFVSKYVCLYCWRNDITGKAEAILLFYLGLEIWLCLCTTAALEVPIIRPQDDKRYKLYCALMEVLIGNNDVLGENPVQVPLFPPQTPHKLPWKWPQAYVARGQTLTNWLCHNRHNPGTKILEHRCKTVVKLYTATIVQCSEGVSL